MSGIRQVLRHRDLRLLFIALGVSSLGSWAYNVALLAFVYEQTGSLAWVGAAGLARFVPALVVSPYAGIVAERFERVRLLVRTDLLAAALQAALVVVAISSAPVVLALVLSALTAIVVSVYPPAVAALIPQVAGEDELAPANALRGTIDSLVIVAGPAIGALVLALGPTWITFAINAVTFTASALIVARLRVRSATTDVTAGGAAGPLRQIADGFRAVSRSTAAVSMVALGGLASFVYGTDTVLLVGAAEERLGLGANGFGLLLAAMGVGGTLMAIAVDRLAAGARLTVVLLTGMAVYCLPNLAVALTTSAELAVAAQVVRGAATLVVDVLAVTAIQRAVAPAMTSRVFGVFESIMLASVAGGALLAPVLSAALGLSGALAVVAVAPAALACLAAPALLKVDRLALARRAVLEPRVEVLERLALLDAAPRAVLERLAEAAEEQGVAAATAVVREGDPADALFVVLDGELEVSARGEAAIDQRIATLGPGSWFGEIGLLGQIPRTATVTAASPVRLLRIDGDAFLEALTTTPAARILIEGARTRLAETHPSRQLDLAAAGAA